MSDTFKQFMINISYKALSGRYFLTVVGGLVFYKITSTLCELMIIHTSEFKLSDLFALAGTLTMIVSNIVTFYFLKQGMSGGDITDPDFVAYKKQKGQLNGSNQQ